MEMDVADTIVAISTPPGRGGIGVVRLAGPLAVAVAGGLVRLVGTGTLGDKEQHGRARLVRVLDPEGSRGVKRFGAGGEPREDVGAALNNIPQRLKPTSKEASFGTAEAVPLPSMHPERECVESGYGAEVIDEALVTVFHAPRSYTGDTVVEIAAHGSPVVLEALVRGALGQGVATPASRDRSPGGAVGSREWGVGSGSEGEACSGSIRTPEETQIPFPPQRASALAGDPGFGNDKQKKDKHEGVVRLAGPGEFTQRAFLAGRLDLTQAEAVQDLIAAQTLDQARVAAQQLGGALSRRVAPAKEALLWLIAMLEAGMDFASGELDDVDVVAPGEIAGAIGRVRGPLEALAASYRRGQLLRDGASIALIGRPNAGKSSLFNRLLERERAIVTPMAGTTRDTVEEPMSLGGVPVRLIDTAGLRVGEAAEVDEAERQGMARSQEALADADLVLLVQDATVEVSEEERALEASLEGRPRVVVRNKVDLVGVAERKAADVGGGAAVWTSALTGEGLEDLRLLILKELQVEGGVAAGGALNTLRQQEAVAAALEALGAAAVANSGGMPHEVVLMDLHEALRAVDSLTGVTTPDDILARIFAAFCIGK